MTVSTADISVLHSTEVVHFHHNSRKSFEELWTQPCMCRPSTLLHFLRCDCIGTLRGFCKESLYVGVGSYFFSTSEDSASFTAPPHKPKHHQASHPNTIYSSSNYLAKTRAHVVLWLYCFLEWFSMFQLIKVFL